MRLYYRFKGASVDRPGGAWWYKDFFPGDEGPYARPAEQRRAEHLSALRPFLAAYAETDGSEALERDGRIEPPATNIVLIVSEVPCPNP